MQDLDQQVREAGERQEETSALFAAAAPYFCTVVVAVALLVAVMWWRSRGGPDDVGVPSRRVSILRAAVWARGPYSRLRRDTSEGHREHSWPVLCKEYEAEFMAMFSGSGSGKSKRVIIPMMVRRLRERRVSLVLSDPKGELFDAAYPYLGEVAGGPPVYLLSTLAKHKDGMVSAANPFADPDARDRFLIGVFASKNKDDSYWNEAARRMWNRVAEVLEGADLPAVFAVLDDLAALDALAERDPRVGSVWPGSELKGSHHDVRNNALVPFEALRNPRIGRLFSSSRLSSGGEPTFEEREMVYLCAAHGDRKQAGPLFAGLVAHLQHAATERSSGAPPVEFVIDEAGTSYPLQELEEYLNMCRGYGVNIALFFQDYSQAVAKLGADLADSVIGAAELIIIGRTKNRATRRYARELSGTAESEGDKKERPRIREEDVTKLRKGEFYVFDGTGEPSRVRQRTIWPKYRSLVVPARAKRGKPNLVRPRRRPAADPPQKSMGPPQHRQQEPRSESAPDFARSSPSPTSEPPKPQTDHPHRRDEDREKEREAARSEAIGRARAEAPAGPKDAPPADARSAEPTVPTFSRAKSSGLRIINGEVMRVCTFCTEENPASAEQCKNDCPEGSLA